MVIGKLRGTLTFQRSRVNFVFRAPAAMKFRQPQARRRSKPAASIYVPSLANRNLSALAMTLTDDNDIASAAITGDSSSPVAG